MVVKPGVKVKYFFSYYPKTIMSFFFIKIVVAIPLPAATFKGGWWREATG